VCAPASTGELFLEVLELFLEALSQQSPHGRQSQAELSVLGANGLLSAEEWPDLNPRAELPLVIRV